MKDSLDVGFDTLQPELMVKIFTYLSKVSFMETGYIDFNVKIQTELCQVLLCCRSDFRFSC